MRRLIAVATLALAAGVTASSPAPAGEAGGEAAELCKAAGLGGGLAVVSGEKDLALARGLAGAGSFFVQVLEPDAARAAAWRAEIADGALREKLGVAGRSFDPENYGSALLNLLVLQECPADRVPGAARVLAPGGTLAVRKGADEAATAKAGLKKLAGPAGWTLLQKAAGPIGAFAPSDALRWRAGSRYQQISGHDFRSVYFGDGKVFYREGSAQVGGKTLIELYCRDAYNGRLLWKIEEEPFDGNRWKSYLNQRMGLVATPDGKVYTGVGEDFVCLDAETGKVLATLAKGGRPGNDLVLSQGRYLVAGGQIIDTTTNRKTGTYRGGYPAVSDEAVFTADGRAPTISAFAIPDGKPLWTNDSKDQPGGQFSGLFCTGGVVIARRSWPAANISVMDARTGKTLWTYPPEPRPKVRDVLAYPFDDKLVIAYDDKEIAEKRDFTFKEVEAATGKVLRDKLWAPGKKWSGGCWGPRRAGDYILYHHNYWFNVKTKERSTLVMFRPKCDQGPLPAYGMIYGFAGRKAGAIKGLAALAPRDIEFNADPGGKVLVKLGAAPAAAPLADGDWPMFRGNPARGNAVKASLGGNLEAKWTAEVGLGGRTLMAMDSERTGLAQATAAWGKVFVADIDGGRVVALDAGSGKQLWSFHAGARVAFSPTLYEGLCLLGSADGWVHCLDAATGKPVYRLLAAPRLRLIGGEDKLESMWPVANDIFVAGGVAYVSAGIATSIHGGIRVTAFKPQTGEVLWAKCVVGKPTINDCETTPDLFVSNPAGAPVLMGGAAFDPKTGAQSRAGGKGLLGGTSMEDWLATNSLHRLSEDQGAASIGNGWVGGRMVAFSDTFGAGFGVARIEKSVLHVGKITLTAKGADGKTKWDVDAGGLNIDDLLVAGDALYCAGHYEGGGKPAELRVISPADGKTTATVEIKGFPAMNGMSAAGKRLFVATRDGKLICYEGK